MPRQELDGVELFNLSLSIVGTVLRDGDQRVSDLAELFEVSEAAIIKAVMAVANSEDVKNYETHFYVDVDELAEGYVSLSQGHVIAERATFALKEAAELYCNWP